MTLWIIEIVLKSMALAALILGLLWVLRKRSAADRSFLAHAGMIALLALVPASLTVPDLSVLPRGVGAELERLVGSSAVTMDQGEDVFSPTVSELVGAIDTEKIPADQPAWPLVEQGGQMQAWLPWVPILIYVLPVILLLTAFVVSLTGLFRIRKSADVIQSPAWLSALARAQAGFQFREGAALLVSEKVSSPISWGFIRPVIIIDKETASTSSEQAKGIVAHELAHVIRGDWLKLMIGRLVVALFWFNPMVWKLAREAHQLREEATDDAVLMGGTSKAGYAELLVDAARHDNGRSLAAAHGVAAGKNSLRRRVERILDDGASRQKMTRPVSTLVLVVVAGLMMPVAALTFQEDRRFELPELPEFPELPEPSEVAAAREVKPTISVQVAEAELPSQAVESRQPDVDTLVEMQIHGVTREYEEEIARAYPSLERLTPKQLIEFKIHGVNGTYLRALRSGGFDKLQFRQILDGKIHGVNPEFVSEIGATGFTNMRFEDLIEFRIFGVDPDYIRAFQNAGYQNLTAEDLIEMRTHGVDIRSLERLPD